MLRVRYIIQSMYYYDIGIARYVAEQWETPLYRQQGWTRGDGTTEWEPAECIWARF